MSAVMWQPATRQEWYRLAVIALVVAGVSAASLAVATNPASGATTIDVGGFDMAGVNQTVDGDVTGATVAADLSYSHDVPDAERRVVKLKVAPTDGSLETIAFVNDRDIAGTDSGTVTLSSSLTDHPEIAASDLNPPLARNATTTVTVVAEIEITRANGETVTDTVRDTAMITLTDGAELTAQLGGNGEIAVSTA